MIHRYSFLMGALILSFTPFLGCKSPKQERFNSQSILKINFFDGEPNSLHPHTGVDIRCLSLEKALFEGLMRLDTENRPIPAAAQGVEISEDQLHYTFYLRSHYWSNGEEVTAHDFVRTWRHALAPRSACLRTETFYPIKNAERAKKGLVPLEEIGVKALDDYTLLVELENPTSYFLDLVASPLFSPVYKDEINPTIFNGPFIVGQGEKEKFLQLKKNPLYWDSEHVRGDEILVLFVRDPQSALGMFEKGEIHTVGDPFTTLTDEALAYFIKQGEVKSKEVARSYWINCNTERYPLTSASLRRALSLAIDRTAITEHLLLRQMPCVTVVPNTLSFLKPAVLPPDLKAARYFFDKALEELKITREKFPALTFKYTNQPQDKILAQYLQQTWEEAFGIKIHLIPIDWKSLAAAFYQRDYQLGASLRSSLYNDPMYHLAFFKEKNNMANWSGWEDPEFKALLDEAEKSLNPQERRQLLIQAEELLIEATPTIPLFTHTYNYLLDENVEGFHITSLGYLDFKNTFVKPTTTRERA